MKKIAVLLATGYEEGESLFLTDVLRRAGFDAKLISTMDELNVTGAQNISCVADAMLDESIKDYDMIIIPGGMPGAANLRDNPKVIEAVRDFDSHSKYIGAICAGPMVLKEAGISGGRKLTSYPADKYRDMFKDSQYTEDVVVTDGRLITSRGPACTLPFAYAVVDLLGGDSSVLKEKMLYKMVNNWASKGNA